MKAMTEEEKINEMSTYYTVPMIIGEQTTPQLRKKTALQEEREARDLTIFNEYNDLVSIEGQSRTEVNKYLMQKYNIHSTGTLYAILKRAEKRNKAQEERV